MSTWPRRRTVADVMTTQVHVAGPDTPFKLLVRLIEENRVSAIPIVDSDGVPLGIVSEADLLLKERRTELVSTRNLMHPKRRRAQRAKAEGVTARDLMTSPALTISSGVTLTNAARLMQKRNVRRLVVVDDRGKIAGLVSRSDLLQVFLRADEELREEILGHVIPSMMLSTEESLEVGVRYNVVTLEGEVDRKSDADLIVRMVRDLDGVVEVIDCLQYRWDDTVRLPLGPLVAGDPLFI